MKIGAYQFAVSGDIGSNLSEIERAVYLAKSRDVRLLIFPECALTGYPPRDIPTSSCIDFSAVRAACGRINDIAAQTGMYIVAGTVYKEYRIYNRALLFRPDGRTEHYDKRALWGWDADNFTPGTGGGIFDIDGMRFGVRICYEVRFPEYFRELYKSGTDADIVLFYDTSDTDDTERYSMIRGHLQTRAVENVTTVISVNALSPYQTAPTAVFDGSGRCMGECLRNSPGLLTFELEKRDDDFGERGRRHFSDLLTAHVGNRI